jgi:hypothetical protein
VKRNSRKVNICCDSKNQMMIVSRLTEADYSSSLTGIKGGCVLNEIPHFHACPIMPWMQCMIF